MNFELIGQWLSENLVGLSFGTVIAGVGAYISYMFIKHVVPNMTKTVLSFIYTGISNLFGVKKEGVEQIFEELPVMNQFRNMEKQLQIQNELKLVELKNKIVSPKLSNAERVAYEGEFNLIVSFLDGKVSKTTKALLDAIENAAKEKLGF